MNKEKILFKWVWNLAIVGGAFAIMFNGYWWGVLFLLALIYGSDNNNE